ncbi:AAA domain-containing protein [Paraburkholderia bonniea]|uniref:AAA domain-containing protein n=1 Tax=Paraburkholderia bonniea TaxID=2152891 RepID=UPI001290AED7|nr:AAA domain-containing protein [Paraburkholderia bonniea]
MPLALLDYLDTPAWTRLRHYIVKQPHEDGKNRSYLDLDKIKSASRELQVFGLSCLKRDEDLVRERRQETKIVTSRINQWLGYYRDSLRFLDLDGLAQFVGTRKTWFGPQNAFLPPGKLAAGRIPLATTRTNDPAWKDIEDAAEQAAQAASSANADAALPSGAPVLVLLGYEYKKDEKDIQRVVCGLPAILDPDTGELSGQPLPIIINARNLSTPDREARAPRLGRMLTATEEDALASATADIAEEDKNKNEDDGSTGESTDPDDLAVNIESDTEVLPNKPAASNWALFWARMNEEFRCYQDEEPRDLVDLSWESPGRRNNRLQFLGVAPYTAIPPANRRLVSFVDQLLDTSEPPALLEQLIEATSRLQHSRPSVRWNSGESQNARGRHTGHMGGIFGLDRTQRLALWQTTLARDGNAIAVSGPPGTGKTSMLQGVIATFVVQSVLNEKPCVVLAASQTNQATTNMIKAFSDDERLYKPEVPVSIERRWIDGFPAYGSFFPSASKLKNSSGIPYQLVKRGRLYDPALIVSGLAKIGGDEHGLSMVTAEEIRPFVAQFRECFDAWLAALGKTTATTPAKYLRTRVMQLVGAKGFLGEALDLADQLYSALSRAAFTDLYRATQRRTRLSRPLPKDRAGEIQSLSFDIERMSNTSANIKALLAALFNPPAETLIDRLIEKIVPRTWRASYTRELNLLTRLRRILIDLDPGTIPATDRIALVKAGAERLGSLSEQISALEARRARWTRWQSLRTLVEKTRHAQLAGLAERLADADQFYETLSHLGKLARRHRGKDFSDAFTAGFKQHQSSPFDGTPIFALGKTLHTLLGDARPDNPESLEKVRHQIECVLDLTLRYEAFHLSMRYWEARWLEEASKPLPDRPEDELRVALERAAMLSPVTVATVQTIPALALYLDANTSPRYLTQLADWLIVDEAGQVPPHLAVPIAGLARRALVVGDVEQLEPVVEVDRRSNLDLRHRHDLNALTNVHERDHLDVERGNFMAVTQYAAARHEDVEQGRFGVMLKYHYRCRKTIIEFCNQLVYGAIDPLVPMIPDAKRFARSPEEAVADEELLPPMGFVAVVGRQTPSNDSQVNLAEVDAIVGWFKENGAAIARRYGKVERAVAVIAPYGAQVARLRTELRKLGLNVQDPKQPANAAPAETASVSRESADDTMVVGTVHSLQGAEKEVVIFSAVNDGTGKSAFIDRKKSMLNVAVSRAKHSFIAFGHPDVILKRGMLPGGVLGRYLREHGWRLYPRDLVVLESPSKVPLVQQAFGLLAQGISTGGHLREVDIRADGTPSWTPKPNAETLLAALQAFTGYGPRHYDQIWLATDDDREGEAIAWHVMDLARKSLPDVAQSVFRRMRFYAMSPEAMREGMAFGSMGVDPQRVRAALSRAIADAYIAREIEAATGTRSGRVSSALLDEIDHLEIERTAPRKIEAIDVSLPERDGLVRLVRLDNDEPLGQACGIPAAGNLSSHTGVAAGMSVEVEAISLTWEEPDAPQTTTAEVLRRLVDDLHLEPAQAMDVLQVLYTGEPDASQSEDEVEVEGTDNA